MGVSARGRRLFGVSSREVSSPHPRMGGWEIPPPRGGRAAPIVRRSSFLPPYAGGGGAAPPWGAAPAIGGLGASHIAGAGGVALVSGGEAGRQWPWPVGLWSASDGFGCGRRVRATRSGRVLSGVRGGHGIRPCGAGRFVCARAYVRGHFSHRILSLVTQSIARTVEVSELPAAARVVAAVGVVIYNM